MKKAYLSGLLIFPVITALILFPSCEKNENEGGIPVIEIAQRNVYEDDDQNKLIDVTIRLSSAYSEPVSVTLFTIDSTAIAGDDYLAITNAELVFSPGETEKVIDIEIISDTLLEFSEYFRLRITQADNGIIENPDMIINIIDNDSNVITLDEDGYSSPESYPGMKLFWSDEFNTESLNLFMWNYEVGMDTYGKDQLQEYTRDTNNVYLENGKLFIKAIEDGGSYTSGRINTVNKRYFKYGLIEIRAKTPEGAGIWPSLWMLSADYTGTNWPLCGEIDIMDLKGQYPYTVYGTAHYTLYGPAKSEGFVSLPYLESFGDQFHIYSILWQPDRIEWYVDNKKFLEIEQSTIGSQYPFNSPFYLYLNVAVGGTWPGPPDDSTPFPQTMEVDYIRAFVPDYY